MEREETQDPQTNNPDPSGANAPYPGFGKRHDIFYQYQSPEADNTPAPPSPASIPAPPAYLAQLPAEEEYNEQPAAGGHKKLLILSALIVTAIAAGVLFVFLHGSKKSPSSSNNGTSTTNQNPDAVTTTCYTFTLPKPHPKLDASYDSCAGSFPSGSDSTAGVTVVEKVDLFSSIDDMVASWKTNNPTAVITSQGPATFGQYTAEQLFWNPPNSNGESDRTVLVLIPINPTKPTYTDAGAVISGFEISGRYDSQSSSKTVFDSILGSWVWK